MTSTFESFYAGTAPRLLRYAYGLTGDMAEAQDFTQEAYARAWPRWKRLQQYDNPESWLRLVVSRLAVDRLRWLGVRRTKTPHESQVTPPPSEEMVNLVAALKRLPMPQRRALVLHYFLDMPVADIAAETGANINTVKTWLARGRINMAAELAAEVPPAKPDFQEVRTRARRRRNRTFASIVAAFFATATAAATAFFAIGDATPPTLRPDIVVPYANEPRSASTLLVDQRAVALWHGVDKKAYLSAIDLQTGTQPWPPVELGEFDDSLFVLGVRDGVIMVMGVNDSAQADNFTLLSVDVNTGGKRWMQTPEEKGGGPLFHPRATTPDADTIVLVDETTMRGVEWLTGRPAWTAPSTPDARYSTADGNRFAVVQTGGLLRIVDVDTGRTLSERSGLPEREGMRLMLSGDWLYLLGSDGLWRIPVTGTEPASRLTDDPEARQMMRCGKHVCLEGRNHVAVFDALSGTQLWRRQTQSPGLIQATEAGFILSIAGTGPRDNWGSAPDDHQLIFDSDGRDITPSVLGTRKAYWIDKETLMFEREIDRAVATGPAIPARNVELSVYSLATGREQTLGREHLLYSHCSGSSGRYVCAGKDGFVLFR